MLPLACNGLHKELPLLMHLIEQLGCGWQLQRLLLLLLVQGLHGVYPLLKMLLLASS